MTGEITIVEFFTIISSDAFKLKIFLPALFIKYLWFITQFIII